ncbi:MAG: DNA repair protein RadA [Patescibacteria group bacterium]|nr:DNA repair protein RadA [Patescibacteria group bacterium]
MSQKIDTLYVCSNCDAQFSKWNGRCLECGAWGTLQRQTIDQHQRKRKLADVVPAQIIDLNKIKDSDIKRLESGILEIDRVLGGGIVPGSLILLAGEPGIGKSTMLAQLANSIGRENRKDNFSKVIYVSGEESAGQIKNRIARLGDEISFDFISEINLEKIIESFKPDRDVNLVIIDSIQTVYSSLIPSETGSVSQIRTCAVKLLELAKTSNIAVIITGHITKDGQVAGPKTLEHIVDAVVYLENEPGHNYSILRASKNRFGSINEIGVFEMTGAGFREIGNPSAIFVEAGKDNISGSVISCVMEGTRPFFVEIQALTSKTPFGYPQRKASGFDLNRLQVLCAVLTKRTKVNLSNQDIILNVAGGLKVNDPALDLAVCSAIISSLLNQPVSRKTIVLGEVGLGGEVRNITKLKERLAEAKKLGYEEALIPDAIEIKIEAIKINKIGNLEELIKIFS